MDICKEQKEEQLENNPTSRKETYREKLRKEHPDHVQKIYIGGCYACPEYYGYEEDPNPACAPGYKTCSACWDREVES